MRFVTWATIALLSLTTFSDNELNFDFRKNIRHTGDAPEGFLWKTGLRLPFSFSHSKSRLGIDNGNYIDLAGKLKSSLHYRHLEHDWSNSFILSQGYSMSPYIKDRFIKSQDSFRIESRYLYNLSPWLSLYAHARMETSIFEGIDFEPEETNFEIRDQAGNITSIEKTKALHLTDPFQPLFFQENVGVVAALIELNYVNWETRGGLSARQTLADNQRTFLEDKNNMRIIRTLSSFYQLGPTVGTSVGGSLLEDIIEYNLGIDALWPALQWPKAEKRTFKESLIVEANAGVSLNFTSWSSLSYEYTLVRIPDIHPKLQQNHAINLNIRFDWAYAFPTEQI